MRSIFIIATIFLFKSLSSCDTQSDKKGQMQPAVLPATKQTGPVPFFETADNSNKNYLASPYLNTTSQVILNPAHGKPGHRCDIAVGAPLPDNTTSTIVQNNPVTVTPSKNVAITNTSTAVAAGLNPQHGQPGHKCEIAVGAPLSDTAKIKTAPATTTTTNNNTAIAPANLVETKAATSTTFASGLNPKHGEPGHRCDIAVGAPLNSLPKQ